MALQHLRSATGNKRPTPASMADGQLAVNTAATSPGVFFKDAAGNLVKAGPVHVGTSAPNVSPASGGQAGNSTGEAWLDTTGTNPLLKVWNGSVWQTVQPVVNGTVVSTADTGSVTSTMIANGTIVDADINASAAIVDTKLATIATAGKVSNSATTAASANTASAIVARDASGNFSAGTITASVTGNADTATKLNSNRTFALTGDVTGTVSSDLTSGASIATSIAAGSIVDADVSATAAIAGTKVSPNFGGQTITTTGAYSAALGSATTPSFTFTGDLNTGIYSPGADQVAISTNGAQRVTVDSAGRLLIGLASDVLLQNNVQALANIGTGNFADNNFGSGFRTYKARSASFGILNSGDTTGDIRFLGADGTTFVQSASIRSEVASTPAAGVMPGRLIFSTTPSGSGTPTERMRLDSDGRLGLGTSAPEGLLHVENLLGSASFSLRGGNNQRDRWRLTADDNGTLGTLSLDNATGGAYSSRVFIDSTGRVGIGTTTPGAILHTSQTSAGSSVVGAAIRNNSATASTGVILDLSPSEQNPGTRSAQIEAVNNGSNQISLNFNVSNAGAPETRLSLSNTGTTTIFARSGSSPFIANIDGSERARIDSSGRLLVGTSTALNDASTVSRSLQVLGVNAATAGQFIARFDNGVNAPALALGKSRGATVGTYTVVNSGDQIGRIAFDGTDGTKFVNAALIAAEVDGTPGADDMPGRLVMSVTLDGASSPTEALRITNDRVVAYNQAAPAAVNATATLTVANLKTGIITSTSAAATDMTLPTGTDTEGGFSGIYTNMTFEWSVINTGPSLVTVLANTAHTLVGSGAVVTGTSARFASRRTAANTFVTYRLS